jgi:putative oxidoreductase
MSTIRHVQSPLMGVHQQPVRAKRSVIATALALIVGGLFIYAGVLKVWDPIKFAKDIANFHILPWPIGVRMAFYLPWLEIICGLALITGWMRRGAVGILTALTVIFIIATISAKVRGIDLDCGCFGSATKNLTFAWHMVIDFALLGALIALWFWPQRRSTL